MSGVIVDLSVPLRHGVQGVGVTRQPNPPKYEGRECYAYDLAVPSHTGTYFETSAHVFREGMTTGEFPTEDLILPGVCLRVHHPGRCISARDLEAAATGLPGGKWGLLIDVGERAPAEHAYFSRDAATWMVDHGVRIMGSNSPLYDTGFDEPTGFFTELFQADLAVVANLIRLEELPADGFDLVVLPLAVEGVGTVGCRVVAVVSEA